MSCELIHTIDVHNTLGEGILWDDVRNGAWWTDIEEKQVFFFHYASKKLDVYTLPERLCSFAFIEGETSFLAALETGLSLWNPINNTFQWLEKIYEYGQGTRLNDGRVDRKGQFWVGAMIENKAIKVPPSNLYRYSGNGQLSVHAENIQISNSLSWSPDGTVMYFADSLKNEIYKYDVNPQTGNIKNKQVFASTAQGVHPDGSCVDSHGYLWNAQWGSGKVARYSPDGDIDYVLDVPCQQPTCLSFGGPNLNILFVTSARLDITAKEKKKYPQSGNVFIYKTAFKGLKEPCFKWDDF